MVPQMKKFKILDLFSGAGGFSYGFETLENFETLIALDFDSNAIKTFSTMFPKAHAICGDITDQNIKNEIIELSKKLNINMIIGGPPCQGFSLKGKNLGINDPRNFLFLEYYEIVQHLMPEIFVIENVKAMISAGNGYFINQIEELFTKLGYFVEFGVLNSSGFGVPQSRERTIIIGCLNKPITLPNPDYNNQTTVRDAISDLYYLESGEGENKSEYRFKPQSEYQVLMRNNSDSLFNHVTTKHSEHALYKLSLIPPEKGKEFLPLEYHGKQKFQTTWSRLEWDKPSPTIDTRFDTPSNGRNSHPILNRSISPREAARIQSFPDTFIFLGPKTSICRQIGNAVPPLLAKNIALSIIDQMQEGEVVEDKNYEIINDNALVVIKELKRKGITVDHIITDPPYNISKPNNFNTMKNPRTGINFGEWDSGNFDLFSWIQPYSEILDRNGSFIIFCSYIYISDIIKVCEVCNLKVKDIIVWQKSNPMPRNINRRYVQDMEFAIWAVKDGSKWIFNKPENIPYLRSLYKYPVAKSINNYRHPTQKSLELLEDIIRIHTNENDLILDPFMGSGTTGVAAVTQKRKFIGIELDRNHFKFAKERLKNKQ